jgi:hypothetical protein
VTHLRSHDAGLSEDAGADTPPTIMTVVKRLRGEESEAGGRGWFGSGGGISVVLQDSNRKLEKSKPTPNRQMTNR